MRRIITKKGLEIAFILAITIILDSLFLSIVIYFVIYLIISLILDKYLLKPKKEEKKYRMLKKDKNLIERRAEMVNKLTNRTPDIDSECNNCEGKLEKISENNIIQFKCQSCGRKSFTKNFESE